MSPRGASLWQFILSKAAGFQSAALLGMGSYASVLRSLLKYSDLFAENLWVTAPACLYFQEVFS